MVNIEYLIKDDSTQFWVRLPNGKADWHWKTCSIRKLDLEILKGAYITIKGLYEKYNDTDCVFRQVNGMPAMSEWQPHIFIQKNE